MTIYDIPTLMEKSGASEGAIRRHLRDGRCPAQKVLIGNYTRWIVAPEDAPDFVEFLKTRVGNKQPLTRPKAGRRIVINGKKLPAKVDHVARIREYARSRE